MVTLTQEQLMNSYPVPEDSAVKVVTEVALKEDQLDTSDPSTVQEYINSQPSTQESTQGSTQNDHIDESIQLDQRQSLSSQSSSVGSVSTLHDLDDPHTVSELIKRAKTYLKNRDDETEESKSLITELLDALVKSRAETGHYKIKSQLLSISSKDADMRYEVENELIKRQVERLKSQGENMDVLMSKITHQKMTLKKYKNEIINKNKEIIRLRSRQPDNKRRRKSNSVQGGMLDTLGMLASQVLTEEEKSRDGHEASIPNNYALPKLNSFKHRSGSQTNGNGPNETTISEYSVN